VENIFLYLVIAGIVFLVVRKKGLLPGHKSERRPANPKDVWKKPETAGKQTIGIAADPDAGRTKIMAYWGFTYSGPAGPEEAGVRISDPGDCFMIGRAPDDDFTLKGNDTVSAHHAYVEKRGEEYVLFDNGSTNGTRVRTPGGAMESVREVVLEEGMEVRLGQAQLVFRRINPFDASGGRVRTAADAQSTRIWRKPV